MVTTARFARLPDGVLRGRSANSLNTPSTHPLQGPAFIVVPRAPDAVLRDTGLPVFPIYAENDDDPQRQWGADSRLMFTAPTDGEYVVRLRDARGFQGPDYNWTLRIREPQPDFTVAAST
ncbi:MAG: hypothetical protein RIR87_1375, partial [Actinomycetota bacterium]